MKKNVFLILICFGFIFSCSNSNAPKTTLLYYYTAYNFSPEFLNGQLKSVTELSYWAKDNNGSYEKGAKVTAKELNELGWSLDYISAFDIDGNIVQTKYLLDDNRFNFWNVESQDGKIIKATYTSNDTVQSYQKIDYQGINEIISSYKLPENELTRKFNVTNNEAGIVKKLESFNPENEFMGYFIFESNEENRIIGYKRYNAQDSLLSYSELTYNDKGFFTKHTSFDGKGNILSGIEIEYLTYDENENWLTVIGSSIDGPKLIFEREYEYY